MELKADKTVLQETESLPSPDALVERVQLVGLQHAALEHLDHSRLDAGGTNRHRSKVDKL